ncbi:LysR family transcriptional regulator [Spirillospora sp. NPDC000708]
METHRLKYFLRIAEEGSMTRAANVLGVAQPALSRQIRLLEEDLGVTLFQRTSRGVRLTDEGERLRASVSGPLKQLEIALQHIGSPLARVERGLRIGMLPTVARVLAAPLLAALADAFPRMGFQVTVASTDRLAEGMLKGAIDLAVVNQTSDDRVFCRDLLVEELVVVGGSATGLRADRPITFAELTALPLVLPDSSFGIGGIVENAALRLRLALQSRFAADSLQVSLDLIDSGLAHGVLPLSACNKEIAAGRLRYAPLCDPTLTHRVGVAATAQLELPRDLAFHVGDIIRRETGQLVASGAWPAAFLAPRPWDPRRP